MLKYDLMYEDKKIGSIEEGKMNIVRELKITLDPNTKDIFALCDLWRYAVGNVVNTEGVYAWLIERTSYPNKDDTKVNLYRLSVSKHDPWIILKNNKGMSFVDLVWIKFEDNMTFKDHPLYTTAQTIPTYPNPWNGEFIEDWEL